MVYLDLDEAANLYQFLLISRKYVMFGRSADQAVFVFIEKTKVASNKTFKLVLICFKIGLMKP